MSAEEAAQALEALRVSRGEAPADPRTALARCANLRRRIAENRLRATPIVRGVACPRCGEPAKPHLDPKAYAKRSGRTDPRRAGGGRLRGGMTIDDAVYRRLERIMELANAPWPPGLFGPDARLANFIEEGALTSA